MFENLKREEIQGKLHCREKNIKLFVCGALKRKKTVTILI